MITKEQYTEAMAIVEQYRFEQRAARIQPDDMIGYAKLVAYQLGTTLTRIRSKTRLREVVYRRMILTTCLKQKYPTATLESIGEVVNRDHTSIVYGLRQSERLMAYDDFNSLYNLVDV